VHKLTAPVTQAAVAANAPVPPPPPSEAGRPKSRVTIKGLTGTLNKDDVHQTMEARQEALDQCIAESRRRLRWVSGTIRFAFKVDAQGAVADVHPTESDIGHHALETCIRDVLAQTLFPKPAGEATATFDWGLSVEPANVRRVPEPMDPEAMYKVLQKHAREIREKCEVKRRERFTVTAYITRKGKLISAGAVPKPAQAVEKVQCLLDELASLRMPRLKREAKVTFELR
jgi:hypothetical protein